MRHVLLLALSLVPVGCFDGGSVAPCVVTCNDDKDCPDDLTCSPEGRCSPGHACPCEPNTVLRCNDATSAQVCAADGASSVAVACVTSCVSDDAAPHCRHVTPQFTPEVCDVPATRAELVVTGMVSSEDDSVCTQVISQGPDAPEICVIRANRISIGMPDLVGKRVFAFVSDGDLVVDTLLVYAVGATRGPGASGRTRGAPPALDFAFGGDGAPFARSGGRGGGRFVDVSADPFPTTTFYGGHSAASEGLVSGGGGGGGVMLTSCQGTVNVARKIDAGGGGGGGGRSSVAGAGGGSGGRILIQGMDCVLQGTASLWANGGGGGGGVTSGVAGVAGADALPEARTAFGGGSGANKGGDGGFLNTNAQNGGGGSGTMGTQGGGGGSVGVIEIAVAPTASFVLSTTEVSPSPSVSKSLPVR